MSKTDLDGAVVVITGGGRGIGRATASAFADRGARVVIGDLDEQVARQAANDIGRSAHGFALDVASRESYTSFLETVKREVGPIDVLVNNAGIMPAGAFADTTLELVRATIDVNLWGVMLGCHLVLPDMMSRGHGHIINVASLLAASPGVASPRTAGRSSGLRIHRCTPTGLTVLGSDGHRRAAGSRPDRTVQWTQRPGAGGRASRRRRRDRARLRYPRQGAQRPQMVGIDAADGSTHAAFTPSHTAQDRL